MSMKHFAANNFLNLKDKIRNLFFRIFLFSPMDTAAWPLVGDIAGTSSVRRGHY